MTIETRNPIRPNARIPIAEIFEICSNSFREGFAKTCQTLLHLKKNDFIDCNAFIK